MGTITDKLTELGLELPPVATPAGSYVPALRSGNLIYTSGQLPLRDGGLVETGKVGSGDGLVSPERAGELAAICTLNGLAAIGALVDLDDIVRVVKVVGFVASDPSFSGQPGVINGASDLIGQIFGENGQHARSAVGVAVLPLDAPVEVEFIVEVG